MTDPLGQAESLNNAMREMSDVLTGLVNTLVREGWTEPQARALVVATYLQSTGWAIR